MCYDPSIFYEFVNSVVAEPKVKKCLAPDRKLIDNDLLATSSCTSCDTILSLDGRLKLSMPELDTKQGRTAPSGQIAPLVSRPEKV